MNPNPIPRVYLGDPALMPQTRAHHVARYHFASTRLRDGVVVDLMCGSGYGSEILRLHGALVTGVDSDPEAIEYARLKYPDNNFILARAQDYLPDVVSGITWFEGIEHISKVDGREVLQLCADSLPTGGLLILSTPRDMNAKYNPWHLSEWSLDELVRAARSCFSHVEAWGQDWDTAAITTAHVADNDFFILVCRR